ncbi:MAG: 2OG-Fe(II) oxygenase [Variovorax sp.]
MTETVNQPISPDLRKWIGTQLAAGHQPQVLQKSMLDTGWSSPVVCAALAEFGFNVEPAASAPMAPAPAQAVQSAAAATVGTVGAAEPATRRPLPGPSLDGEPLFVDAGDRRVRVLQTMTHPRVVVFGDLVAAEECEQLIELARARLARSLTVEMKTGGEMLSVDRTSDGMFFQRGENEVVARLDARIAKLLNWPVEFGEGLQILRYAPGAQYAPHYDYFDPNEPGTPTILKRGGQRVGTLVMYIGEPEKGGATTFPDVGLSVAPQRGSAVFFSYDRPAPETRTLHGGAPVVAGEKWVATKWLREAEFI